MILVLLVLKVILVRLAQPVLPVHKVLLVILDLKVPKEPVAKAIEYIQLSSDGGGPAPVKGRVHAADGRL